MSLKEHSSISAPDPELESEVDQTAAWYLFAIFRSSTAVENLVRTGQLQEYLSVTPASVSEMIAKLDANGYVEYEKYQGVRLTTHGEEIAERVSWRFCIVSSFFESMLDVSLDERTAFEISFRLPKEAIVQLRDRITTPCLRVCPESGRGSECCIA